MTTNPFFKNTGPHSINYLITSIGLNVNDFPDDKIIDIKDLNSAQADEISFFHSKKYAELAKKTKASYCLTTENLRSILPNTCKPIVTNKVLLHTAQITKIFYPDSVTDDYDNTVEEIKNTEYKDKIKFGRNVLIGKNVKIGSNCLIGHNSIIEKNVSIGDNCTIGSNVIIRNSLIKNNVHILDGCVIGKKGFGFFPDKNLNFRYPQIGVVIIEDNVFVGARCIIVEGVRVQKEAVLGANVVLTASTKIIDVTGESPVEFKGNIPVRSVVIPGTYNKNFKSGSYQVPCALIIGKRKESTDKKTSLNEALREHNVSA